MGYSIKAPQPTSTMNLWKRLVKDEEGFAMEWIVIVLLVAAALVGLLMVFSQSMRNMMLGIIGVTKAKSVEDVKKAGNEKNANQDKLDVDNAEGAGNAFGGEGSKGGSSGGEGATE